VEGNWTSESKGVFLGIALNRFAATLGKKEGELIGTLNGIDINKS